MRTRNPKAPQSRVLARKAQSDAAKCRAELAHLIEERQAAYRVMLDAMPAECEAIDEMRARAYALHKAGHFGEASDLALRASQWESKLLIQISEPFQRFFLGMDETAFQAARAAAKAQLIASRKSDEGV